MKQLPNRPYPQAIIEYIKAHESLRHLLENDEALRRFCKDHYPEISFTAIESVVRTKRAYKYNQTNLKNTMNNALPGMAEWLENAL